MISEGLQEDSALVDFFMPQQVNALLKRVERMAEQMGVLQAKSDKIAEEAERVLRREHSQQCGEEFQNESRQSTNERPGAKS
jgi:hypothetical protein